MVDLNMKKTLAFGGSTSKRSINKRFAAFAASRLTNSEVTLIDLNNFEMPLFSVDLEAEIGSPDSAGKLKQIIKDHDALVISLAEHNGNFPAAFKNIIDWMSRLEGKIWEGKPIFLLSTSPGRRGGKSVLEIALNSFPRWGGEVIAHFSLPSFKKNFSEENGILDDELKKGFEDQLAKFEQSVIFSDVS